MSKKRDSDTLFELITRQKAKPNGSADGAPPEDGQVGAPAEDAADQEAAPAAVEVPPAVEPQPQTEGATPRFGETSVPFSVKVIVITALVIFAFLLGRYTARKGQSDGEPDPAVLAPAGDFFGYAWGEPAVRSLLLGTDGDTDYVYFPMPFDTSARIELLAEGSSAPVAEIQTEVCETVDG